MGLYELKTEQTEQTRLRRLIEKSFGNAVFFQTTG